ncbi:uncharacterized protein LOC116539459 [Sapajus apella]|uniref:Uncharacterized protein LOC116539459 n=1 Tax=Sapajus apella TaxID=9515 RepID=A0A6J3GJU2_SAPAP|nr:uncharacterized protein LOC116539459 [Sapajus apella]
MGVQRGPRPSLTGLSVGLLLLLAGPPLPANLSLRYSAFSCGPLASCAMDDSWELELMGMGGRVPDLLVGADLFYCPEGMEWAVERPLLLVSSPPPFSSAVVHQPQLCQTIRDADGHHYPGFLCPVSDSPEEAYCCHLKATGGSCYTPAEFEALYQVNLSALPPPVPHPQGPGPAPSARRLYPAACDPDDRRPRALLLRSGPGSGLELPQASLWVLRRELPAGHRGDSLGDRGACLHLPPGAERSSPARARAPLSPAPL